MHQSHLTPKYVRENAWFRCTVKQKNVETDAFSLWITRLTEGICFSGICVISKCLDGSTGDEEPLVDAAVDRGRWKVLARGDGSELALVNAVRGVLVADVGTGRRC